MTDQICRIVYYILCSVEMFLVGEAIFHDRVREKSRYAAMAVMYVGVIIPTVLYVEDHFWIEIGLNIAIYICLFQGRIARRLARFWGVYLFVSVTESIVSAIGYFLLRLPLQSINVSAVRDRQAFVCGCKFWFDVIYRPQEVGTKTDRIFSRIEMVSVCGCCSDGTEQHVSVGDH